VLSCSERVYFRSETDNGRYGAISPLVESARVAADANIDGAVVFA
jgi:hypothetical protein